MNPIIGRTVRFDGGTYRHLEGIVLAAEVSGRHVNLVIEVTQNPMYPPERDGANAIAFISFDTMQDGRMLVKPRPIDADALTLATKEFVAALDGWSDVRYGTDGEKSSARNRLFAARGAVDHLLGLPPRHRAPPTCRHCMQPMPPPNIDRQCTFVDGSGNLYKCERG